MSVELPLLRPARKQEADALGSLCLRSKAVWGYDEEFMAACRDELSVTAGAIDAGLVQVCETGGTVTGVAEISVEEDRAFLEKLFVEPGRMRSGAGRALFVWACTAAAAAGADELIVEADPGAVPFYEKMGCIKAGHAASGSIPGRTLPRLVCKL